ncbi:hypothetical protein CA830_15795, partial [Burkholderia multivorans]
MPTIVAGIAPPLRQPFVSSNNRAGGPPIAPPHGRRVRAARYIVVTSAGRRERNSLGAGRRIA